MSNDTKYQNPVLPPGILYGIFVDCGVDLIAGLMNRENLPDEDNAIIDVIRTAWFFANYRKTFDAHKQVTAEQNTQAVSVMLTGFGALQALGVD